jgi:ubiquitin carboxyl-terminal hydrolase 14
LIPSFNNPKVNFTIVLTHVGRAADSGHYIGWVKSEKGDWWKFDDDTVSLVTPEEITKLEGGGDWHTGNIFCKQIFVFF